MKNLFSTGIFIICGFTLFVTSGCDSDSSNDFPDADPGVSLGIASVSNMRDMGGYTTTDGQTVNRELVYRSNQLYQVTPEDMQKISNLNLKNIFDLRREKERKAEPEELPPNVNYVVLDVLSGLTDSGLADGENLLDNPEAANAILGNGKIEEGFEKSYRTIISLPTATKNFGKLFLALCDEDQLPALFHCKTGKDRTGWAAACFLSILGVPRDVVMQDYMQSNEYVLPDFQDVIDSFIQAGGEESIVLALFGVKEEYMEAAFNEMEIKYGNIETYFSEALNIDTEQQQLLRDIYLK